MQGPRFVFFLLKKPCVENQSYFLQLITETLLRLFKSGLWRKCLALISNLDFTPFRQDKLMQVSIPSRCLLPEGHCVFFFISHSQSGENSSNPNRVTHILYNYPRGL